MYDFEPSDEQQMLIDWVHRYASQDLRPKAHEAEETGEISQKLIEKGWELGVFQASVPEDYGGFGDRSAVTGVLAVEELAWGDLAGALAVMMPSLFGIPILLAGSEEQKKEYLPSLVDGEWKPYTAALLEPQYDFDPNELETVAQKDNGGYLLKGKKMCVPFAKQSKAMLVYARYDDRTQGFIVPTESEGVEIESRQKLLGINALPTYAITLHDVLVPEANRLGGAEGHDFEPVLAAARVAMAALSVGLSRAAYEYSRDYAKEREAFGVKIAQKQAIAFMLAEMATEIEAIRLLVWESAWMIDQNKPEFSKSAYLAHIGASDMAMMVTDRAVQILGGHGYIREHPVELWMRNGRGIATLTGLALV